MNLQRCHLAAETLGCSGVAAELTGGNISRDNSVAAAVDADFSFKRIREMKIRQLYCSDSAVPCFDLWSLCD